MMFELAFPIVKAAVALWAASPLLLVAAYFRSRSIAKANPGNFCAGGACAECDAHLECVCPHHDRYIMKMMNGAIPVR